MNIQLKPILIFAFKFLLFSPIIWIAWWFVLPQYAWIIGQISGTLISIIGRMPIEAVTIVSDEDSFLNSNTSLIFTYQQRQMPFDIASLVANLPPFLILILATPKIKLRPAIRALLIGTPIIAAAQIAFIFSAFTLMKQIEQAREIPEGIGYVLIALPFLLWVVLIHWQSVAQYIGSDLETESDHNQSNNSDKTDDVPE
jgi:hypothetical protein